MSDTLTEVARQALISTLESTLPTQEPAPRPGAFGRTVPSRVARRMLQLLMDLRVPVSVEYACADVALSVPFSYASTLDKTRESAERDLEMGMFAPCQVVKP